MLDSLILLVLAPLSAPLAGLSAWLVSRREALEDGALLVRFLTLLGAWMLLIWGLSHVDGVRFHLDPAFRLSTQLERHPLYSTIERMAPTDSARLSTFLAKELAGGATLQESFLRARPLLTEMATQRLGFADQRTHLEWGRSTLDTLKTLQASDPRACYRAITTKGADPATPLTALGPENTARFQEAVIAVYISANEGMRHDSGRRDTAVELNEVRRDYLVIRDEISRRFGRGLSEQLGRRQLAEPPTEPIDQICAARIAQLEAILRRPQPLAAAMIDAVLR